MNALDLIVLTEPPQGGYGPLLNGLRTDDVPQLAQALTTDLRSGEAKFMRYEFVKREAEAYLHAARPLGHRGGELPWHVQTWARAHLVVARFIADNRAAPWVLDAPPGALGRCVWRVRTGRYVREFWAVTEGMPGGSGPAPRSVAQSLTGAAVRLGGARVSVGVDGRLRISEDRDVMDMTP